MKKNNHQKNLFLKNKLLWLIFFMFTAITFWGLVNHVPWRDEAQAWLIVRDLNLTEIIGQMPYEGTPPLWHLTIFPLVKLGAPYEAMLVVHYLLALTAVFLLLFYSPLPKLIKIILPFGYYFLFEYSLVARNYNLSALLLFLIAILYKKRFQHPLIYACLIFLLSWTNVHSLAIAGLLLILFIYDFIKQGISDKKLLISSGLMATGLISAVIIMFPAIDQAPTSGYSGIFYPAKALVSALFPVLGTAGVFGSTGFYFLLSLTWLPLIAFLLKTWQARALFLTSLAWLSFIFAFKHSGDLRHYGLILIIFIFCWWLDLMERKIETKLNEQLTTSIGIIILTASLLSGALYGGYFYLHNQEKNFSGAKEMASYLQANNLDQEEIASYPSYTGSALLPYMPGKEFYQLETLKKGTFLTWNTTFFLGRDTSYYVLKNELKKYYQVEGRRPQTGYILLLTIFPPEFDPELEFMAKSNKETVKEDEFFYLYKLALD